MCARAYVRACVRGCVCVGVRVCVCVCDREQIWQTHSDTSRRGRPKRRFMDLVKEDMAEVEVTEEDAEDRSNWRWKIRCGDP